MSDECLPTWSGPHPGWNKCSAWKTYFDKILPVLEEEMKTHTILPARSDWFNAFEIDPEKIRVVLMAQDPYPTKGDAHGYAFSVQPHRPIPASLRNIFKEYEADLGFSPPSSGDLRGWAQRGVFLFNTALTVRQGVANSHTKLWERFTYETLSYLSRKRQGIVWVLLGSKAQEYRALIDESTNLVICAGHPSPLNRTVPFLGSKIFSRACEYLKVTPEELWKIS